MLCLALLFSSIGCKNDTPGKTSDPHKPLRLKLQHVKTELTSAEENLETSDGEDTESSLLEQYQEDLAEGIKLFMTSWPDSTLRKTRTCSSCMPS